MNITEYTTMAYNLKERVVRAFILILICVTVVFTADSIAGASDANLVIQIMLKMKWVGIIFLPATYLHFSDSLLTLTGSPSRGRRLWAGSGFHRIKTGADRTVN